MMGSRCKSAELIQRALPWAAATALFGLIAYLGWLFWGNSPINWWDEVHVYLGSGNRKLREVALEPQWGPAYVIWYYALSWFTDAPADLATLNAGLMPVLVSISWFALLLRLGWPLPIAALASLLAALQPLNWLADIKVHSFALFLSALAGVAAWSARDWHRRLVAATFLTAILVFARPELLVLFPCWALCYAILFLRKRPRNWLRLHAFSKAFALAFLLTVVGGILSGQKESIVFFKKNWERLATESPPVPYRTEVELQQELYPGAKGALSAAWVNPTEFFKHSLFQLKEFFRLTLVYVAEFFSATPVVSWFCLGMAGLGMLYSIARRGRGAPHPFGRTGLTFFLLVFPYLAMAALYGTLWRYNIALAYILASLPALCLYALPRPWQYGAFGLAILASALTAHDWRNQLLGRISPGERFQHYKSFSRQLREAVKTEDMGILTDCGALWVLVSSRVAHSGKSDNFYFLLADADFRRKNPPREFLRRYDVVAYCGHDLDSNLYAEIKGFRADMLRERKDFRGFRFEPMGADVYIREDQVRSPLPEGVTRLPDGA